MKRVILVAGLSMSFVVGLLAAPAAHLLGGVAQAELISAP